MLVKYMGSTPDFIAEYNGERYYFSLKKPIRDIPAKVFGHIMQSGHIGAEEIFPYELPEDKKEINILKEENAKLRDQIALLLKKDRRKNAPKKQK